MKTLNFWRNKMADFKQAVEWIEEGKTVLVNGGKKFSGTGLEFINANFELDGEDWDFKDCIGKPDEFGLYEVSAGEIKTLKQHIFEDIQKELNYASPRECNIDLKLKKILDKRFGF